jgi:UDP-N-acetylmuramoylalanine--D-glutamate ligase
MNLPQSYVVLGAGRSGLAAYNLLKLKNFDVTLVNRDPVEGQEVILESEVSSLSETIEALILSPGIPRTHPLVQSFLSLKRKVWSEIELGWRFLEGEKVFGLTGTNGKTTTISLMEHCLKEAGVHCMALGNIGKALCEYIIEREEKRVKALDWVLLELSSFQLESMDKFSPDCASILNITMSHGERYSSLENYTRAKLNLLDCLGGKGKALLPEQRDWMKQSDWNGEIVEFSTDSVEDLDLKDWKLPGNHNLLNLAVCREFFNLLNISKEKLNQSLSSFMGVEHRLEFVPSSESYKVFNDSKSSNWEATLAALSSFQEEKVYLVLGGQKRGEQKVIGDTSLLKICVQKVLCIGESAEDIQKDLEKDFECLNCETIEKIQESIEKNFNGVLLFSPAYPSFDQFENYAKRGEAFKKLFLG